MKKTIFNMTNDEYNILFDMTNIVKKYDFILSDARTFLENYIYDNFGKLEVDDDYDLDLLFYGDKIIFNQEFEYIKILD